MAGFLYIGAGLGMIILALFRKNKQEQHLTKSEIPFTVGMIVLDIAAPIFLLTCTFSRLYIIWS